MVSIETIRTINGWVHVSRLGNVSNDSYAKKREDGVFEVWILIENERFIYSGYFEQVSIENVEEKRFVQYGNMTEYNELSTDEERAVYIARMTMETDVVHHPYNMEQVVELLQASEVLAVPEGKTADYAIVERMNEFLVKMANDWQDAVDQAQIAGYVLCNRRHIDFENLVNHEVEFEAYSARANTLEKFIRELNEKLGYESKSEMFELVEEILKRVK